MNQICKKFLPAMALASLLLTQSGCMASKMVSDAVDGPKVSKTERQPEPPVEPSKNYWAALGYVVAVPVDIVTFPIQAIVAGVLIRNVATEMDRMGPAGK
jgi:hypothetical protein